MPVDYNNFSKTFAKSRENMKWEEIAYFFSFLENKESILDIGCGSGRLLELYQQTFHKYPEKYLGIDLSQGLLDEAKKIYGEQKFIQSDMLQIKDHIQGKKYDNIFLIASFHHLDTLEKREILMRQLFEILSDNGKIYMTHWALESGMHKEKYKDSCIQGSENEFGSKDFNIKFGKYDRYYHSFSLSELEYLIQKSGLKTIENRLFENEKNIITILSK